MMYPPPTGPPAGWYPDPDGSPAARYFDGRSWSDQVAARSPWYSPPVSAPDHPTLPFPVVIGAVAILAASLMASRPLLDSLIDRSWPVPVLMLVSVVVGYGPSLLWLLFASRRWGSGRPLVDLGVRFRWADVGWGPLVWVSVLFSMGVALAVLELLDVPYRGNLDLGAVTADINRTAVVSLVLSTVVCAPIVEEAIFRGAVLRGLLSRMPAFAAVVVQGVLFGAAHFNPDFGVESLGLIVVLSVAGVGFGAAAFLLRRIGPTVVAHAILNAVAISVALATN